MKHYSKYKYVYNNWYVASCEKHGEKPIDLTSTLKLFLNVKWKK
jgi:hypothetical protein